MAGDAPTDSDADGLSVDRYADVWDRYCGHVVAMYDNANTAARRRAGSKNWLAWCEQTTTDPFAADEDDIRRYVDDHLTLADTTISSHFDSVSLFYEWLSRQDEGGDGNPTTEIVIEDEWDINRSASQYVQVLDDDGKEHLIALAPDRVRELFGHAPNPNFRNELIIRLLWDTAVRSVELANVRIRDVDLDKRAMWIDSAKLNRHDHPDLHRRQVRYTPETARMLEMWLDRGREAECPYVDDADDPDGYVFVTDQTAKMRPSHISRIVKRTAHNAGIQEAMYTDSAGKTRWLVTAHRLRHSRITNLANGVDRMGVPALRRLAGHARVKTTMAYVRTDWSEVGEQYRHATRDE